MHEVYLKLIFDFWVWNKHIISILQSSQEKKAKQIETQSKKTQWINVQCDSYQIIMGNWILCDDTT